MYDCGNVKVVKSVEYIRRQLSLNASLGLFCCACSCFFAWKKHKSMRYSLTATEIV